MEVAPGNAESQQVSPEVQALKTEERLAEANAVIELTNDPETDAAIQEQLAIEREHEARANMVAIIRDEEKRKAAEEAALKVYPWGFTYLQEERSIDSIFDKLTGVEGERQESTNISSRRETSLEKETAKARELTLSIAAEVSQLLQKEGVGLDTEVAVEHRKSAKTKRSVKKFITKGYMRNDTTELVHEHVADGWLIGDRSGQKKYMTAILTENGGIIAGIGKLAEHPDDNARKLFSFLPSRRKGSAVDKSPITAPEDACYLNEEPESDPTLENYARNNPMARAQAIFRHERGLQDAMVQMLIDRGIKL